MRAQVGSGKETSFGKITGAKVIKSDNSDGERENATKRAYTKKCENLHGPFGPNLAGGNAARFEELRKHSAGNTPDSDVHGEKGWDALPGQKGT
jgi:hypothetical protein